ncbi:hypothetical protein GYMLUDRAFT_65473 [Collybiopsis luxurians FD-317 M1]|uniref:Uncharacterized protein n=1 Tax=Collybiopsis luxurians FD-317 M1 TaxID=944289 RepID=A0A0D0BKI2_9AGAR|nr:hypothetical protein GYMLUDRAFT_65473 [Collybiopsis luxurians FD-317 M1]
MSLQLKLKHFITHEKPSTVSDEENQEEIDELVDSEIDTVPNALTVTPQKARSDPLKDWTPPSMNSAVQTLAPIPSTPTHPCHKAPNHFHAQKGKGKTKAKELQGRTFKWKWSQLKRHCIHSSDSEDETCSPPPEPPNIPPKRKHGRPHKEPTPELEPSPGESLPLSVYLYTEVEMPMVMKPGKTAARSKMVAQPNFVDGPCVLLLDTNWGDFIDLVCKTAKCTREQLVIESLRWSWRTAKGTTKSRNPITTAVGHDQMVKSLKNMDRKERDGGMVYIFMAQPRILGVAESSRPWNLSEGQMPSANAEPTVDLSMLIGQKVSVDARLKPIIEAIENKYPIGKCAQHPTLHCLVYEPKQWHFDLDRNWICVFAMAVYKKEVNADLTEIPLTSVHFHQSQTIGYQSNQGHGPASEIISTATMPHGYGYHPSYLPPPITPYSALPAYPFPMPAPLYSTPYPGSSYPSPYGLLLPPAPTPGPQLSVSISTSSSGYPVASLGCQGDNWPSPPPEACDLQVWCKNVGLDETIYAALDQM